ncbi:hypothetical protein ACFSR7_15445 [Cohnella sp. GCM10020058]|uniref:hypothetical protein n=1 Tax=Cohnella sp. GCM10020058 TaxID=3317330 RepID=UPI00362CCAB1
MAISEMKLNRLKKKFPNLEFVVLEESYDGGAVDVFAMKYQKNGPTPNRMSEGLIEVNAMWDEGRSRPKGYIIAAAYERPNGYSASVMVSEQWLANSGGFKKHRWERELMGDLDAMGERADG